MTTKKYALVEIYPAAQAEGHQSGRPVVFCRFAGCSANCPWCDTDWEVANLKLTQQEMLDQILSFGVMSVVFTGGEPALQLDRETVAYLQEQGVHCAIETNGRHNIDDLKLDWVCVSPKSVEGGPIKLEDWKQRTGNELKVVYPDCFSNEIFFEADGFDHYYVSPCNEGVLSKVNFDNALLFCQKNPRWWLNVQWHKLVGMR